jgi:hypothetical protein
MPTRNREMIVTATPANGDSSACTAWPGEVISGMASNLLSLTSQA